MTFPNALSGAVALMLVAAAGVAVGQAARPGAEAPLRERLSLDQGWRFHLGDVPLEAHAGGDGIRLYGADITHHLAKAGHAWGAAARGFDDSGWEQVCLPHDWGVEQPFEQSAEKAQGYRPRGIGWYRRSFKLDPSDRGRNIEVQFDGVATHCTVYFNGSPVHHHFNGYTSFHIDVSSMARYGDDVNTLAVRVDAGPMEGWWYEGAGIYRHTWLVKRSPVHVVTDGVWAQPVKGDDGRWTIPAEVTLANTGTGKASAQVAVAVLDSEGRPVASGRSAPITLVPTAEGVANVTLAVPSPRLWSLEEPNLYTVRTVAVVDGVPLDSVDASCGFRTIRFDVEKGFFLNDQPLKLQGTCNHQDHAGVGVAVPDSIQEFRIRRLKEMGSNAYRTAHNPPSRELLDLCDRMGLLVMDETRYFNASPEYLEALEWLVRRDRNHPSVILWSLFNEEALQGHEEGMEMARTMRSLVRRLDPTRPTTGGQNKGLLTGDRANPKNAAQVLDVVGINYQAYDYDRILGAYPDKPALSTEDTSQIMTRGEYSTDRSRHTVAAYDDVFPGWDKYSGARHSWEAIATRPRLAGGFSWTGFDYRGEPTPYGWPSAGSFFGAMDLCGFPKTEFHIRQALWVTDKPVLTLVPHWNWPGKEGQPIKVMALANCDSVELLLNGTSLGEKPVNGFQMVAWEVSYAPGTLQAIGRAGGRTVSGFRVETTGDPVALHLVPDRTSLAGDGSDAMPVTIETLDAQGRHVPTATPAVEFKISGPGRIIGLGNGDPNSHEPEKGNRRSLFNGLAQVIVQSTDAAGEITLTATAGGLTPATATLQAQPCAPRPSVPVP